MTAARITAGLVLAAVCATQPLAQTLCGNGLVTVESARAEVAAQVCTASDRALAVFADCGIDVSREVTIRVEDEVLGDCLGIFHCGKSLIEVLKPKALARMIDQGGLYAHIPTADFFESVVIHEMVHAIYDGAPCDAEPTECFVTSEYLAYAVQLHSIPARYHDAWAETFDRDAPVSPKIIGLGTLMLDTDNFALGAWAHFRQREDTCRWIAGILDGQNVFRRPRY